jgi:radical SAM protein with 4Fe4S-binding SPASM domain
MEAEGNQALPVNRSSRTLNLLEFSEVKHKAAMRSAVRRRIDNDPSYATEMPGEFSLQLTYSCNLRCNHCYQWNDQGFFREYDMDRLRSELDISIIERLLADTADTRAKVNLWGGEPLMYRKFPELAELLVRYPRLVNICTNGLLIKRNLEHIVKLGENLNVTVSLDGLGADHEALRGPRTFSKTEANLRALLDLKRSGEYTGEVTINCMVSNETVGRMYEFMEWANDIGVRSVFFQLPWYISPAVATDMDILYENDFAWLNPVPPRGKATWHSYTYRIEPENVPVLQESMRKLASRVWRVWLRYQPEVSMDDVGGFILGHPRPVAKRSRCLSVSNRMEVHADGKVSSCKFFPEFVVGDLAGGASVTEVWQSEDFRRLRAKLRGTGLMPVCSKCFLLYEAGV